MTENNAGHVCIGEGGRGAAEGETSTTPTVATTVQLPEAFTRTAAEEQDTVRELVRPARERGTAVTGPGGLLKALTKMVIEAALDEEMTEHLGYDRHDRPVGFRATPVTGIVPRRC